MHNSKNQKASNNSKLKIVHCTIGKSCPCKTCATQTTKPTTRRLKIQPKYVVNKWSTTIVPQIILQGKWLRKTGFESNAYIVINQKKGVLMIKLAKE